MANIEVELPDGSIAEFPDTMPLAEIDAAIKAHLSAPSLTAPTATTAQPDNLAYARGLGMAAINVPTFGFGGEYVAAPIKAAVSGQSYDQALQDVQGIEDQFAKQNPVTQLGAELGAGALMGGSGIAKTLLQRLGLASAGGALSAAGYAPEGQKKEAAVIGGVVGPLAQGAIGEVALPLAGKIAGKATELVRGEKFSPAAKMLSERLAMDGQTPQRVQRELAVMGPDATVADAGGGAVKSLADAVFQKPEIAATVRPMLTQRQAKQAARIDAAAQKALGIQGEYYRNFEQALQKRSQAARPLYEKALSANFQWSDKLDQLTKNPRVIAGMNAGLRQLRDEADANGVPFNPQDYAITAFNDAGDPTISGIPNMRVLHAAKVGLDRLVEENRDPLTQRVTQDGLSYMKLRDALRKEMVARSPDYKAASDQWAGDTAIISAMNEGRSFAKNDAEAQAKALADMTPSEKQAYREGVYRQIKTMMDGTNDERDKAKKLVGSPKMRTILMQTIDNPKDAKQFMRLLKAEVQFNETKNFITGNSATARRLEESQNIEQGTGVLGAGMNALRGDWLGLAKNTADAAIRKFNTLSDTERAKLGQWLFSQNPVTQKMAMKQLGVNEKLLSRRQLITELSRAGGLAATPAIGNAAASWVTGRENQQRQQ